MNICFIKIENTLVQTRSHIETFVGKRPGLDSIDPYPI